MNEKDERKIEGRRNNKGKSNQYLYDNGHIKVVIFSLLLFSSNLQFYDIERKSI